MAAPLPSYTPLLDLLPGSSADIHRAAQDTGARVLVSLRFFSPEQGGPEMVTGDGGGGWGSPVTTEEKTRAARKVEYEHIHANATWGACMPSICPRPMTCTPHPTPVPKPPIQDSRVNGEKSEEPMLYTGGCGRRRY